MPLARRASVRGGRFLRSPVRHRRILPLLALALVLLGPASGPFVRGAAQPPRTVAIGDIHGAGDALRALLESVGLIDEAERWVGGTATLVQTGDFTDRGPEVRAVMDLLMRLEREARAVGGRVQVLLGNHETMNLMANVRDVTPEIYGAFASDDAIERRESAYRAYEIFAAARAGALGRPLPDRLAREEWMEAHPPGFVEYLDAFGSDGVYGQWLRSKPIAVVLADSVFVHGGLHPSGEATSVDALNQRAQAEIARFDDYRRHLVARGLILPFSTFDEILTATVLDLEAWLIRLFPGPPAPGRPPPTLSPEDRSHLEILFDFQAINDWSLIDSDGPVWFRGFAQWSEEEGDAALPVVLDRFGVSRAVVGHTVTATRRITPRFGGRVFLIDTGMLASAYGGQPSALELSGGGISALYVGERVLLAEPER